MITKRLQADEYFALRIIYDRRRGGNGAKHQIKKEDSDETTDHTGNDSGAFADERKVTLRVKEARLGYMGIHDVRNREREKEGKMIPVWDFLGSVSVEYFKEGKSVGKETYSQPDLSLMTINAMDGSVMERRDMGK